jgi:hypothetical protein
MASSGFGCEFVSDIKIVCNIVSTDLAIANDVCVGDDDCRYGQFEFGIKSFNIYSGEYKNAKNANLNILKTRPAIGSGGVITIATQTNATQVSSTSLSSLQQSQNAIKDNRLDDKTQPIPTAIDNKQKETVRLALDGGFKSKLSITDPYVCGVGSYGNVPNPKEFGVDYVYYDFYKTDSNKLSYKFKLHLNENGDFFLPISESTNIITDGEYRVVYSVVDNEGNKARGEYTDYITNDCSSPKLIQRDTIRTGGENLIMVTLITCILICSVQIIFMPKSKIKHDFNQI